LEIILEAENTNIYVIGDSIANGIASAGHVSTQYTDPGKNTTFILQNLVQSFIKSGKAKGATVILSSGAANSSKVVTADEKVIQQENFGPISTQIKSLKDAGASVALVGVASKKTPPQKPTQYTNGQQWTVDYTGVNQKLASIASSTGAKFLGPLEEFDNTIGQHDGIHPFNGYSKLFQAGSSIASSTPAPELKPTPGGDAKRGGNGKFEIEVPSGRTGTEVADIQKALIALGYDVGPNGVDGIRGPDTSAAVKQLQSKLGVTVDGDPGPETVAALNKLLASKPDITSKLTHATAADVKIKGGSVEYNGKIGKGAGATGSAKSAVSFFVGKGWSPAQAAGIVGNLQAESGANLNTSAVGDGGLAYGIAQWHPDRQARFKQVYGKDIRGSSLDAQLEFVHWELTHTESNAGNRIKGCDTPQAAAATMDQYYERSNGAARGQRVGNAVALMPDNTTAVA
jgi:hypothetical protein